MALFGPKVEGDPHKRFPDKYYRQIFFTRPLFEGIEFLAKVERKSKKKMANELMALAISRFMEERIHEYNIRVIAAQQLQQEPELTRFIILLRRRAKEKGYDLSKFI
jgi:ABC-type thiamine transport system substrate-binding protein